MSTELHQAVEAGNLDEVKRLIAKKKVSCSSLGKKNQGNIIIYKSLVFMYFTAFLESCKSNGQTGMDPFALCQ